MKKANVENEAKQLPDLKGKKVVMVKEVGFGSNFIKNEKNYYFQVIRVKKEKSHSTKWLALSDLKVALVSMVFLVNVVPKVSAASKVLSVSANLEKTDESDDRETKEAVVNEAPEATLDVLANRAKKVLLDYQAEEVSKVQQV